MEERKTWIQETPLQTPRGDERQLDSRTTVDRSLQEEVVPGKGWEVWGEPQGYCDGTYNAICGIDTDNECVLYGHHDE